MLSLCYPPETCFGIGYKLFLKGVEMSKFFNFKIALPVAISVIGSGSALAALNCTTQPTCEQLGYSKSVDANCEDYILCPFDTSYKKCITGKVDCTGLGFTQEDKSGWCGNVITCPTDASYTLCAEAFENPCPNGYDSRLTSVADCGEQGSKGWTFSTQIITGNSGENITCGKCTPKTCSGYYEQYQSVSDCGSGGSRGWQFATCYSGDTLMGKCTEKTCASHGYKTSSSVETGQYICKKATAWLGNRQDTSSCYDCAPCNTATTYAGVTDRRYIGDQSSINICGYDKVSYAKLYGLYKNYVGISDGRVKFSDNQGRTAKGCDVWINIGASVANGADRLYCCKNGSQVDNRQCGL